MTHRGQEGAPRGGTPFPVRYGAWALVAGASQGLGAAYATALAERGMKLLLVARRRQPLEELAAQLHGRFGLDCRCLVGDLADAGFLERLRDAIDGVDLGVLVYNAAHAPMGDFASLDSADILRALDVNTRGPATLVRAALPSMIARGRGAIVLMTSLAGNQGTPRIATYAATKAFNRVLAEGLWRELRGTGIDVVACCAGAIRTPGYASSSVKEAPGTMDPRDVAERALCRLGRGPVAIPGLVNRAASFFMTRILPRRAAIGIMTGSTSDLGPTPGKRKYTKETTP